MDWVMLSPSVLLHWEIEFAGQADGWPAVLVVIAPSVLLWESELAVLAPSVLLQEVMVAVLLLWSKFVLFLHMHFV